MGCSEKEYRMGLPLPSPGDLPDSGIKPRPTALQADALPSELPGKPQFRTGRHVIPLNLVNILPCWLLQLTQRMAKTLQPSITKKSSPQGGRPKSPETHCEWWEFWLPWLNHGPHCLSAPVAAIWGESKLPACSVGYPNWSLESFSSSGKMHMLLGVWFAGTRPTRAQKRTAQMYHGSWGGESLSPLRLSFSSASLSEHLRSVQQKGLPG